MEMDVLIYINLKNQNKHRLRIIFCGTENFLKDLNITLFNQINTSDINLIDMNKYGNNVFNLRYINNDDINKLYQYMYKKCYYIFTKKKKKSLTYFLMKENKKLLIS